MYSSPHIRAIETLCYMLATHPKKNKLTIVLLPLAKEALLGLDKFIIPRFESLLKLFVMSDLMTEALLIFPLFP